jgi:tetratricopeptide (TPR) repeat protein
MSTTQTQEFKDSLEHFRNLLFHYQLESGSIQKIFQFFESDKTSGRFDALRELDPNLMTQLLAREYVNQARRAKNPAKARAHLETALHLDPNCPEACFELASISENPESAMMWYQRSIAAAENLVGKVRLAELLAKNPDKPWLEVETLTYLKAYVCLAEKLFRHGYYDAAAKLFKELLQISPSDELKLRHYLMVCLLVEQKITEAEKLLANYRGDATATWYYCKAFLHFKREGDSRKARRNLIRAFSRNLWIAVFLLGIEEMPTKKERMQEVIDGSTFTEGSRQEAFHAVQCIAPAFCEDSLLIVWVWEMLRLVSGEESENMEE